MYFKQLVIVLWLALFEVASTVNLTQLSRIIRLYQRTDNPATALKLNPHQEYNSSFELKSASLPVSLKPKYYISETVRMISPFNIIGCAILLFECDFFSSTSRLGTELVSIQPMEHYKKRWLNYTSICKT